MSDTDIEQLVDLLKQFEAGFLPYPVFEQIARLVALPILEFVPLRKTEAGTEVLLIARTDDDPLWPGLLHTPGTVIRATDLREDKADSNWPAFERITHDELLDTEIGNPQYVGSTLHASKRGVEQAQLYWVEVLGEPKVGSFYNLAALPAALMESQLAFITEAARNFEQTHG